MGSWLTASSSLLLLLPPLVVLLHVTQSTSEELRVTCASAASRDELVTALAEANEANEAKLLGLGRGFEVRIIRGTRC